MRCKSVRVLLNNFLAVVSLFYAGFAASPAAAQTPAIVGSNVAMTVMARSDNGTAILRVNLADCTYSTTGRFFQWSPSAPVPLVDRTDGGVIATIRSARLRLYVSESIRVTLDLQADAGAAATSFTITPAVIHFADGLPRNLDVRARASLAARDLDGDVARLRSTGAPGTGIFTAQFDAPVPWGIPFATLITSISALGPLAEVGVAQPEPASGDYAPLPFPIQSITTQLGFQITANDRVTIATNFQTRPRTAILAEPGQNKIDDLSDDDLDDGE